MVRPDRESNPSPPPQRRALYLRRTPTFSVIVEYSYDSYDEMLKSICNWRSFIQTGKAAATICHALLMCVTKINNPNTVFFYWMFIKKKKRKIICDFFYWMFIQFYFELCWNFTEKKFKARFLKRSISYVIWPPVQKNVDSSSYPFTLSSRKHKIFLIL